MPPTKQRTLRVGFFQFTPRFGEVARNTRYVVDGLRRVRADLVVLPELCLTGYNFRDRAELKDLAEEPGKSEAVKELRQLCAARRGHLVVGFAERDGKKLYNSALLIGPRGITCVYRKLHLFMREKMIFDAGDLPLPVRTVRGARVGIMICWDWAVPEVARTLALRGADVICHPSNLVLDYCQRAMFARCVENGVFAVTANRTGRDRRPHGTVAFTGQSQIMGPRGELIYRAKKRAEELHVSAVDVTGARDKMITPLNHALRDRRPEFYG